MNIDRAQAKLNAGYGKLAAKLGRQVDWFRPTTAHNPISDATENGSFMCRLDPHGEFTTKRVGLHGKPIWFAALDRTDTMVGDYIRYPDGEVFFIAAQQDLTPTAVVQCNRVVSILRPVLDYDNGYGGNVESGGTAILTEWPVALIEGTKGERSVLNLPNDSRTPWYDVLMPHFDGVLVRTHDRMTDDLGGEYIISSVELTALGYRLTVGHAKA